MTDLSHAIWRKARRSQHNGGCVEVAVNLDGVVAVRDSKRPEGGAHVVGREAFATFLADARPLGAAKPRLSRTANREESPGPPPGGLFCSLRLSQRKAARQAAALSDCTRTARGMHQPNVPGQLRDAIAKRGG